MLGPHAIPFDGKLSREVRRSPWDCFPPEVIVWTLDVSCHSLRMIDNGANLDEPPTP
jgi:hypothetical protein